MEQKEQEQKEQEQKEQEQKEQEQKEQEQIPPENKDDDNSNVRNNPEIALPFTYIKDYSKLLSLYKGNNPNVTVKICAYAIHTKCFIEGYPSTNPNITNTNFTFNKQIPFLQFVFKGNTFPEFQYQIPTINDTNADADKSAIDVDFESNCFQQVFEFFTCDEPILNEYSECKNPDISKKDILEHYKGYIEHGDSIFVIFDITTWIHVLKPEYTIAIVNEIIHKKKIKNDVVDDKVVDFFKTNDEFTQLLNSDGSIIPYPFLLYLCEVKDGVVDFQSMRKKDKKGFIPPAFYSKLGYSYYFSNTPGYDEYQLNELQRFAVFVVNGLYILDSDINDYDLKSESNINDFTEASTLYFRENGIQLWSIRNASHYTMV
jgi:hypothetical protein